MTAGTTSAGSNEVTNCDLKIGKGFVRQMKKSNVHSAPSRTTGSVSTLGVVQSGRTFQDFAEAVRSSVEEHAERKGYKPGGASAVTADVREIVRGLGIEKQHAVAEIIYKLVEFLHTPKRVLLEKVAGWSFIQWRELD